MADVDTSGKGGKGSKKVSTKVDMTPMVDLAFLLITFFMLTTTFSKPKTMEVNMPDKNDKNETMKVKESSTTVIVLAENDKIVFYTGFDSPVVELTDFSEQGIRKVIMRKNREIAEPIYIIKAMDTSKFKNLVDILDEMAITKSTRYAIVEITDKDIELVGKAKKDAGIL